MTLVYWIFLVIEAYHAVSQLKELFHKMLSESMIKVCIHRFTAFTFKMLYHTKNKDLELKLKNLAIF